MDQVENVETDAEHDASAPYVPSLELTKGQPAAVSMHGGLSYMSFDKDGDAGTTVALQDALDQVASGEGQRVFEMIDNAPPGPIETEWGIGFKHFSECVDYIRENNITAP